MVETLSYTPEEGISGDNPARDEIISEERNPFAEISADSDLDKEVNIALLEDEAAELVSYWGDWYKENASYVSWSTWEELCGRALESKQTRSNSINRISQGEFPKLGQVLHNINNVFGTAPSFIRNEGMINRSKLKFSPERLNIPSVVADLEEQTNDQTKPTYVSEQKLGQMEDKIEGKRMVKNLAVDLARWQGKTIWTMLALDSLEIRQNERGSQTYFEEWLQTMTTLYQRGYAHSAISLRDVTLSGIYGPLKIGQLAHKAGYHPFLPRAYWDATKKMDMIITDPDRRVLTTQIKTSTKLNRESPSQIVKATNRYHEVDYEDERRDFERLRDFSQYLSTLPEWQGLTINPLWVKIYGANATVEGFQRLLSGEVKGAELEQFRTSLEGVTK